MLGGLRAATHWADAPVFEKWFPKVKLDRDALYVVDGSIWTSAGVTTGIDMTLALVEIDCGPHMKGRGARHLVVYKHRPGYQAQLSTVLNAQIDAEDRFGPTMRWVGANLDKQIAIEDLADKAGMSPRTFQRKFKQHTGRSPTQFFLAVRLERAKDLLSCAHPGKSIASPVGFKSEASFRASFKNHFGVAPSQLSATVLDQSIGSRT